MVIATTSADDGFLNNIERPVDGKCRAVSTGERLWQVDSHHGVDDRVRKVAATAIDHTFNFEAMLDIGETLLFGKRAVTQLILAFFLSGSLGQAFNRALREAVLIELYPDVAQCVRRIVRITNTL